MIGLNPDGTRFVLHFCIILCAALCAQSCGLFLSAVTPNGDVANAISPLIITVFMLFGGFYLNKDNIGPWFIWIHYMSFIKYSYEALVFNEFSNETFVCRTSELVKGICPITTGEQVLKAIGFQDVQVWVNILVLLLMYVIYNVLAFVSLYLLARRTGILTSIFEFFYNSFLNIKNKLVKNQNSNHITRVKVFDVEKMNISNNITLEDIGI
jgi:hypothetical protein